MELVFIGVPVLMISAASFLSWLVSRTDGTGIAIGAVVLWVLTFFGTVVSVASWAGWNGAKQEAIILNAKYGTSYTQEDMFWAGNTIKFIIQGQRQRIDVTGVK